MRTVLDKTKSREVYAYRTRTPLHSLSRPQKTTSQHAKGPTRNITVVIRVAHY